MNSAFGIEQGDLEPALQLAGHVRPHHTVKDEKLRRVRLNLSAIGKQRIDHAPDAAAHDGCSEAMLPADLLDAGRDVLIWADARHHHPWPILAAGRPAPTGWKSVKLVSGSNSECSATSE